MLRKSAEAHFHEPVEIKGWLQLAEQMVDELGIADDLRAAAYSQAVALLAQKQVAFEQTALGMAIPGDRKFG